MHSTIISDNISSAKKSGIHARLAVPGIGSTTRSLILQLPDLLLVQLPDLLDLVKLKKKDSLEFHGQNVIAPKSFYEYIHNPPDSVYVFVAVCIIAIFVLGLLAYLLYLAWRIYHKKKKPSESDFQRMVDRDMKSNRDMTSDRDVKTIIDMTTDRDMTTNRDMTTEKDMKTSSGMTTDSAMKTSRDMTTGSVTKPNRDMKTDSVMKTIRDMTADVDLKTQLSDKFSSIEKALRDHFKKDSKSSEENHKKTGEQSGTELGNDMSLEEFIRLVTRMNENPSIHKVDTSYLKAHLLKSGSQKVDDVLIDT
ncbi:hypothetical protein CDAR_255931 [Caerostris darwini]|uniref:Uncharacterized protein n=1 Tax=Caerostris darwini TaxID=1538125 RepID=A0AAV4WZC3_9ARAC|nr:hypothetical protein CDAR_255931 [Caerostris darwini]